VVTLLMLFEVHS